MFGNGKPLRDHVLYAALGVPVQRGMNTFSQMKLFLGNSMFIRGNVAVYTLSRPTEGDCSEENWELVIPNWDELV